MRCAHSAVDYLTDAGGSGPGKRRWGQRYKGNPYCTGRSTAGNGVCVYLHLLVIGRGRERGRVSNTSINDRVEWIPQRDKRAV